jgi:hypothetical protein
MCIGLSVVAMDKMYLIELVRDVPPLWGNRDKTYHNRDLRPKLQDETGEISNVTGNTDIITLMKQERYQTLQVILT